MPCSRLVDIVPVSLSRFFASSFRFFISIIDFLSATVIRGVEKQVRSENLLIEVSRPHCVIVCTQTAENKHLLLSGLFLARKLILRLLFFENNSLQNEFPFSRKCLQEYLMRPILFEKFFRKLFSFLFFDLFFRLSKTFVKTKINSGFDCLFAIVFRDVVQSFRDFRFYFEICFSLTKNRMFFNFFFLIDSSCQAKRSPELDLFFEPSSDRDVGALRLLLALLSLLSSLLSLSSASPVATTDFRDYLALHWQVIALERDAIF